MYHSAATLNNRLTPPSACLSDLWFTSSSGSKWMNLGLANTSEFLPSGWATSSTFSPGVCPSGWIMASNFTTEVSNKPQTVGTCCPQYLPSSGVFSTRTTVDSDEPWQNTGICQFAPQTTIYYGYTWSNEGTITSTPSEMKPGGLINAYGLVVAWQATDSTNPAAATATATATTDTNHTSTSASESTSDDRTSGLSAGAKAGIGFGVSVGAIMVLALLAFLILRRRKRQGASSAPGPRTIPANQKHPTEFDSARTRGYELGSYPSS